jgi:glycosyltransferase involved in cell wall biosynthesis
MISSVKGIADEIVILDTGSTDNTVEVAKTFTDNVFFREWDDSFANARNACQEHCTGDWILWLDCDEELGDGVAEQVKPMLDNMPESVDLILLPIVMCRDDGSPFQRFPAERLQRNGKSKWHADMHNYIDVPASPDKRAIADHIEIIHNRVAQSAEHRAKRAEQRVHMAKSKLAVKAEEEPNDRRSIFYTAGTYHDAGKHEEALEWFDKYFEVSDFDEERYQAGYLAGKSCIALNRIKDAKRWFERSIGENWRRSESDVALAEIAIAENDLEKAEWHYKLASLRAMPIDPMFVEYDKHTWMPHAGLFDVYIKRGEWDSAMTSGKRAIELGAPLHFSGRHSRFVKDHTKYGDRKIAVLVDRGQMDFIQPVIDSWISQGKEVVSASSLADIDEIVKWEPDIIFCEWGGELAAEITKRNPKARIVVRLHGYEVYSGLVQSVDWLAVDNVICVSKRLLSDFLQKCPVADSACRIHVVPGGVPISSEMDGIQADGKQIAMLGFVNDRKNIPLALQILAKCPKHTLHIAGEWQSQELKNYVDHMARELGVSDRLKIYGRVEDKWEFLKDKDFILSTSTRETFHYAIAEGMMCGLKPVIHNWPSADEFYSREFIFNTSSEAVKMLSNAGGPEVYRNFAIDNLGEVSNIRRINRIIDSSVVAVIGHPSFDDAIEYRLCESLERLGFRTEGEEPDAVIVKSSHGATRVDIAELPEVPRIMWRDDVISEDASDQFGELCSNVDFVACDYPDMVSYAKDHGAKDAEFMPLVGAMPPFRKLSGVEQKYDVGFYGAFTERRKKIVDELGEKFDVHTITTYNHAELNEFINSCKVIVNLHAYDVDNLEFRLAECMAAGACVVSEKQPVGHPFPDHVFVETDDLVGEINRLLNDKKRRDKIGKAAYDWIWHHWDIDTNVERVIEKVGL